MTSIKTGFWGPYRPHECLDDTTPAAQALAAGTHVASSYEGRTYVVPKRWTEVERRNVVDAVHAFEKRASAALPDDNPKTVFGVQKTPFHLVPTAAIRAEAGAFKIGETKYGAYNWRQRNVSVSVYYAAALRHIAAYFDGEENDPETGVSHLGHARACLAILIDAAQFGSLNDDRPRQRGLSAPEMYELLQGVETKPRTGDTLRAGRAEKEALQRGVVRP